MPKTSATFSAVSGILSTPYWLFISLLTKRQPMVVSSTLFSRENTVVAFGITNGARDMLSTPPATMRSASPDLIARAAVIIASMPDPHNRFIVVPGTQSGNPASRSDMRATLRLSSPAWLAQPKITSSMVARSSPGFRLAKALSGIAPRSSARTEESAPP